VKAVVYRILALLIVCTLAPCGAKEPKEPKSTPTPFEPPVLKKPETGTLTLKGNTIVFENESGKIVFDIGTKPGVEVMPHYKTVLYEQNMEIRDGKAVDLSQLTLQNSEDKSFLVLVEGTPLTVVQSREGSRSVWRVAK